jgi:hypothetical protein
LSDQQAANDARAVVQRAGQYLAVSEIANSARFGLELDFLSWWTARGGRDAFFSQASKSSCGLIQTNTLDRVYNYFGVRPEP